MNKIENLLLENIQQGIILLNSKLSIIYINQEAESLIGLSENQLRKLEINKIFNNVIANQITLCCKEKKTKLLREINFVTRLKVPKDVTIYINPIFRNDKDEVDCLLIQLFDLEGTNILNQKSKLDDEEKIMSQLFHGLAHEIKNPLASIKGAAQIIRDEADEKSDISECSEIIVNESERLSKLVNTFKYLQPSNKDSFERVNINESISYSIDICNKDIKKNKIPIFFEPSPDFPSFLGNKDLAIIVFINIIKNAYDSIKNDGDIKIIIKSDKGYKINKKNFVIIEIIDSGDGIKTENLKNLFKPFFTTKKQGQGIGLFVSQKIINKFGGYIEAKSDKKNTTFSIFLPEY